MTYAVEDFARQLKAARQRKNLSQRALAEKIGLPQSHISRIESGKVDIQLSSLIEFARVLDLELSLIPRKLVPAVQSIVRGSEANQFAVTESMRKAIWQLDQIRALSDELANSHKAMPEFVRIRRLAEELKAFPAIAQRLDELRGVTKQLKRFQQGTDDIANVQSTLLSLQAIRNRLSLHSDGARISGQPAPAYRLDEDEEQGHG